MVVESASDLKEKAPSAPTPGHTPGAAARRVSAEVLQENASEKGKAEKAALPPVTHCSEWEAS